PTGATPFKGGAPERAKSGHSINPFCEIAGARAPRTPFAAVHEFAPQHRPAEAHIAKVLPKPLAPAGPNHFEPPPPGHDRCLDRRTGGNDRGLDRRSISARSP